MNDGGFRGEPTLAHRTRQTGRAPQQGVTAIESPVQHAAHFRCRGRLVDLGDLDPGIGKAVERQVDTIKCQKIVTAILEVVQHLQSVTKGIGERIQIGGLAMQIDEIAADW